jgi:FMN phosphatase YigB (HAD superfamily)
MRRFIFDLDDTLANTTQDLQGDPARIPYLTLVPGALEFLRVHNKRGFRKKCILLTVGIAKDQQQKIDVLGIRNCFRKIYVVPKPEDKIAKLEQIVKKSNVSHFNFTVIGDRLDIEIRKAKELGCVTVRIKIPGGRHSEELPLRPSDHPDFEEKNFTDLMSQYEYFRY